MPSLRVPQVEEASAELRMFAQVGEQPFGPVVSHHGRGQVLVYGFVVEHRLGRQGIRKAASAASPHSGL